jgi:hypothetical protein
MNVGILLKTGGGPVVVVFGGDYQFPYIRDSEETSITQVNNKTSSKWMNYMTQFQGELQFLNLSEEVM